MNLWCLLMIIDESEPGIAGELIAGWWFGCHFPIFPINIGNLIIPIAELIFFREVAQPPTRLPFFEWNPLSQRKGLKGPSRCAPVVPRWLNRFLINTTYIVNLS